MVDWTSKRKSPWVDITSMKDNECVSSCYRERRVRQCQGTKGWEITFPCGNPSIDFI